MEIKTEVDSAPESPSSEWSSVGELVFVPVLMHLYHMGLMYSVRTVAVFGKMVCKICIPVFI